VDKAAYDSCGSSGTQQESITISPGIDETVNFQYWNLVTLQALFDWFLL
jgi:hypothetical protein